MGAGVVLQFCSFPEIQSFSLSVCLYAGPRGEGREGMWTLDTHPTFGDIGEVSE